MRTKTAVSTKRPAALNQRTCSPSTTVVNAVGSLHAADRAGAR